jgi:F-type H+-transporting ATPase subunit a
VTHVSLDGMVGIAAGNGFQSPGPSDFEFPDIFNGNQVVLAKSSLLLVLGGVVVAAFFLITTRRMSIVPSKSQYFSEEAYGFVRNGIAQDIIGGRDYMRFVPLLTTMFFFILVNNLFGLIPFLQFAPFSRAGFAYALAAMVWVVYNGVGIARHGFGAYLKLQTVPAGVPVWILPLLVPLEFLSNLIIRPITLSLRLFANMFAGHLLLTLFATGGAYLLFDATGSFLVKPAGILSFILGILVGFLELIVSVLQAYVFTLLTATYIQGSLAAEH